MPVSVHDGEDAYDRPQESILGTPVINEKMGNWWFGESFDSPVYIVYTVAPNEVKPVCSLLLMRLGL